MPPLVILLHGVRATGVDMNWLAGALSQHVAGALFAQPDAPFPDDLVGVGRQWFSTKDITDEERPARVEAARGAFDAVLAAILDRYRRADLRGVALVGFSQGAIMGLDAVASGRWPVAACVAFSGRLTVAAPRSRNVPLLLVHGLDDGVVPASETKTATRLLRSSGADVRQVLLPGLGHVISAEGAGRAGRFLARRLTGETG
jgi:phospholipase/carboxylesterase